MNPIPSLLALSGCLAFTWIVIGCCLSVARDVQEWGDKRSMDFGLLLWGLTMSLLLPFAAFVVAIPFYGWWTTFN